MADAVQQLAPPIPPPMPPGPAATAAHGLLVPGVLALCLFALLLWVGWRRFRAARQRWRLRRELERLAAAADADAPTAAQQLAGLVRAHRLRLPPEWWTAIDDLRFRRPAADHAAKFAELRSQVLKEHG